MIKLFTGTPGSGKSLHAAEIIYYRLRTGRPVIANFDINLKAVRKKHYRRLPFYRKNNNEITARFLVDFARDYWDGVRPKEDHILLVLDEAQVMFDSRQWQRPDRHDWITFFAQHRKMGYQIILICQVSGMIDKQMRCMVEYEVIHRKASNFGLFGFILGVLSFGHLFVAVTMWPAINAKVSSEFFRARRKFYRMYDTFNTFNEDQFIGESKEEKRKRLSIAK